MGKNIDTEYMDEAFDLKKLEEVITKSDITLLGTTKTGKLGELFPGISEYIRTAGATPKPFFAPGHVYTVKELIPAQGGKVAQ